MNINRTKKRKPAGLDAEALDAFTALSRQLLEGCKRTAPDGTVLYTPDGLGNYDALWLRDFAYMAEYAGDLMEPQDIEGCIEFALSGQREDGWLPDRVEADGEPVYAAGAKGAPVGKANLDNTPFLVFAVTAWLALPEAGKKARETAACWAPALQRGMDCIPVSPEGLVVNDPAAPHSPYGFTDTVCKTGRLFFESLLYWRACRQLSALLSQTGLSGAPEYEKRARAVEQAMPLLYDKDSGLFFAAEKTCRQLDVWGAAYLLSIGFPVEKKVEERLKSWLTENRSRCLYHGQVCHLPDGQPWEELLIKVAPGEYQNGAYWATASGWFWSVLRETDREAADALLEALLTDFREGGACECVNKGYRKLPDFVVSAVNIRGALLQAARKENTVSE